MVARLKNASEETWADVETTNGEYFYDKLSRQVFHRDELEFPLNINVEKFRWEAAKDILAAANASQSMVHLTTEQLVEHSIETANELIKQLTTKR